MLSEGDPVPNLALPTDSGKPLRLSGRRDRILVLYFYPKDDTSGCTAEARDFSCLRADFDALGAEVVGVSPDSSDSHEKFKRKHDLTLRLASDPEKTAAQAFGVWVEKSMYGRKYMGVERSTFLIDRSGRIAMAWRKVSVPGHAAAVLAAIRDLRGAPK